MSKDRATFQMHIDPELLRKFKTKVAKEGMTMTEIVAEYIKRYVASKDK